MEAHYLLWPVIVIFMPLITPWQNIITICKHHNNSLVLLEWSGRRRAQDGDFYGSPVKSCCPEKINLWCDSQSFSTWRIYVLLVLNPHIQMHALLPQFQRSCNSHLHEKKNVVHHKYRWEQNTKVIIWEHDAFTLARVASCRIKCSHSKVGCTPRVLLCNDSAGTRKFIRFVGQGSLNVFWI